MPDRCQATAKSGKPCAATALPDGLCAWHSPTMEERRRQWSRRGGHQRSNKARARAQLPEALSVAELEAYLGVAFKALIAGRMHPQAATALATVAKAITHVAEVGRLEQRIDELERAAGLRKDFA